MVKERLVGNIEDVLLEVFQVLYAQYLLARLGVAYYEVSETEVFAQRIAQFGGQLLGVLVDKGTTHFPGRGFVAYLTRFHYYGQERVARPQFPGKLKTCIRILHPAVLKRNIRDHAKYVLLIFFVYLHGLLIVARNHNLWPPAHSHHLLVLV